MATLKSFESIPCWQQARELNCALYEIIESSRLAKEGVLSQQLREAALDAMSSIAQGIEEADESLLQRLMQSVRAVCKFKSLLYLCLDLELAQPAVLETLLDASDALRSALLTWRVQILQGLYEPATKTVGHAGGTAALAPTPPPVQKPQVAPPQAVPPQAAPPQAAPPQAAPTPRPPQAMPPQTTPSSAQLPASGGVGQPPMPANLPPLVPAGMPPMPVMPPVPAGNMPGQPLMPPNMLATLPPLQAPQQPPLTQAPQQPPVAQAPQQTQPPVAQAPQQAQPPVVQSTPVTDEPAKASPVPATEASSSPASAPKLEEPSESATPEPQATTQSQEEPNETATKEAVVEQEAPKKAPAVTHESETVKAPAHVEKASEEEPKKASTLTTLSGVLDSVTGGGDMLAALDSAIATGEFATIKKKDLTPEPPPAADEAEKKESSSTEEVDEKASSATTQSSEEPADDDTTKAAVSDTDEDAKEAQEEAKGDETSVPGTSAESVTSEDATATTDEAAQATKEAPDAGTSTKEPAGEKVVETSTTETQAEEADASTAASEADAAQPSEIVDASNEKEAESSTGTASETEAAAETKDSVEADTPAESASAQEEDKTFNTDGTSLPEEEGGSSATSIQINHAGDEGGSTLKYDFKTEDLEASIKADGGELPPVHSVETLQSTQGDDEELVGDETIQASADGMVFTQESLDAVPAPASGVASETPAPPSTPIPGGIQRDEMTQQIRVDQALLQPLVTSFSAEDLDADLIFEDVLQSLEGEEYKVVEILSHIKRLFWTPLQETLQGGTFENIVAFLHSINLTPIRRAIRETAQQTLTSISDIYGQELESVADETGLTDGEKQLYQLTGEREERLLGDLRMPFREFVERLEQLDTALDEMINVLTEEVSAKIGHQRPLLALPIVEKIGNIEEANGIESSWNVVLEASRLGLASYAAEAPDEVQAFDHAMEQFISQFGPTYSAILVRVLEIWSDRLMPPLKAISPS